MRTGIVSLVLCLVIAFGLVACGGSISYITVPSTPTGLIATAATSSEISLHWAASTDDVGGIGYKIFRNGTQISTSPTNSFSDTGLTSSTTYTYTVSAYDAVGHNSAQSSASSATTLAAGTSDTIPPTVPMNLTVTAVSATQIYLSWTASTDNIGVAGYEVYRDAALINTVTGTTYSDTALSANTSYTYSIKAFDGANNKSASCASVFGTTMPSVTTADTQAPSVPTNLLATAASSTKINLIWSASTDNVGVTGYEVWRGGAKIATVTTTSYSDTGLTASTTYAYTVKAVDAAGNVSPASNSATATTSAAASAVTLLSIAITPVTPSIANNATQQFTATGTYSDNSTQNITASVIWTSSDASKANISSAGLATAVAAGTTTIKAMSGNITGTATLTVTTQTTSFLLTNASFYAYSSLDEPNSFSGTWDAASGKVKVLKAGQNWQVNMSWRPVKLIVGYTYHVALTCSSPASPSYTITLKQDGGQYTTYASQSTLCDGTAKTIDLIPYMSDAAAQLGLNFGETSGEYTLSSSVTISQGTEGTAPQIPEGAPILQQSIEQDSPPSEYSAVVIWAQAATLTSKQSTTEQASVTVDYWKVIENLADGTTRTIKEDYNYTNKSFSTGEAGLYIRTPSWFPPGDVHTEATNMHADSGSLYLDISQTPNNIVHWWTPRLYFTIGATYSAEIRFKVEGKTAVQFGSDWWKDTIVSPPTEQEIDCSKKNNCEAWVSDWYGDTGGQYVTVTVPKR